MSGRVAFFLLARTLEKYTTRAKEAKSGLKPYPLKSENAPG
jgi:hypothetical protein